MQKKLNLFSLIIAALGLAACGTNTRIVKSWKDPEVNVQATNLTKFVVVALLKDETSRRIAEERMVAFSNGSAVPSYNYFELGDLQGKEDFYDEKMKNDGMDGVVVMRLVDKERTQDFVPGAGMPMPPFYRGWWGFYNFAWPMYYNPGYYTTNTTYYVETNVYSLHKKKLVWSGITSTINPGRFDRMIDDIMKAVANRMRKEGFIGS